MAWTPGGHPRFPRRPLPPPVGERSLQPSTAAERQLRTAASLPREDRSQAPGTQGRLAAGLSRPSFLATLLLPTWASRSPRVTTLPVGPGVGTLVHRMAAARWPRDVAVKPGASCKARTEVRSHLRDSGLARVA